MAFVLFSTSKRSMIKNEKGIRAGCTKASSMSCQVSSHFFTPGVYKEWWKKVKRSWEEKVRACGAARTAHAFHQEGCLITHEVQIFLLVSKYTQVCQVLESSSKSVLSIYLWAAGFNKIIKEGGREGNVYWNRRGKSTNGNVLLSCLKPRQDSVKIIAKRNFSLHN